jgi:hypothetical protein
MLLFAASTNNFRNPPGDVSFFIPGGAGQPTVYQVFNAAGINLNNFTLDKLPTPDVNQLIAAYARLTGTTPNPFLGASVTGTANDYRNPRAFQMGLGAEHEITSNWVAGIQANYINTVHLQRNRDYNLPFPTVRLADGRPVFNRANRPVPSLGQILVRESSARSMYRGVTFTSRYNARRVQFNVQYTVSGTFSDDDNERDATTIYYDNAFNLRNEYGYSSLDSRHQVTGFAVIRLPWNIELAPTYRFNSGRPIRAPAATSTATPAAEPWTGPTGPWARRSSATRSATATSMPWTCGSSRASSCATATAFSSPPRCSTCSTTTT